MTFAKNEYSKLKRAFIQEAETLKLNGTIREQVDLNIITSSRKQKETMSILDMVGYRYTKNRIYCFRSRFKILCIDNVALDELSEKAVYVYVNDTQTCHGLDYTFSSEGFVQFTTSFSLQVDDKIEIYEYETTNGSYIPETPTKLGLFPAYKPEKFTDTTYGENQTAIRGHDGSIIIGYDDYRDDLIIEMEKRLYNNIKVPYDENIFNIYDYIGGEFRNTQISKKDIDDVLISDFIKWLTKTGNPDYTDNSFVKDTETFTYNYGFGSSKTNQPLAGFWRGIYINAYDTDSPILIPWEMLGFSVKPSWWESRYGPAPYTKDNLVLWSDLERGIIRSTTNVKADKRFIRPGLTKHIPVDSSGNVLSPLDSGYVNEFSFVTQKGKRFKFGDHTPAETAWRRSSEYPFALIKAIMLNRPAKVLGVGFDRSRVCRDYTNQLAYKADVTRRIKLSI